MKKLSTHRFPLAFLTPVLACLGMTALSGTALAQEEDAHQQALRELSIMRNIFAAALEEDESRNRMRFSQPDSLYLAGQGMVFTFNLPGALNTILFSGFDSMAPFNVMGTGDVDFNRSDFGFDSNGRSDRIAGIFTSDSDSPLQEQLRDMSEVMREKQEEMSRLQRDLRRLRRGEENADAEAETAQVENSIEVLTTELRAEEENYRQVMADFQQERNVELDARRQAQTDMIFSTLCEYGKTLDTLQEDEHVNLVLRNFNAGDTRVFVVDFASITSCSSAQALRESAASYSI